MSTDARDRGNTGPDVEVVDNAEAQRYEAYVEGGLAGFLLYEPRPGRVVLIHTEVDPAFEGHGVGGRLAAFALDDLRGRGVRAVAQCPFVADYVRRHPEYRDVVAGG
jgi:predicted GNAT family acetyltransferase